MIRIAKIVPGGFGLGTDDSGKKIFFWNALPGELISEYQITKNKSHYSEAIATSIIEPSSHRTTPRDDCYLSTSPWQMIDYSYELQLKQELVVELFREHQIDLPAPDIFTDHRDYHYRNKMEYALYWDHATNQISLAFHARGSHRKIPITKSSIERPEIFQAAQKIIADLNAHHEEARKYQSLLLRCNQAGVVSGGLYENGQPHPTFPNLTDTILGHEYSYSPNGFFQINLSVYEMALSEIAKHISTDYVLDLYAGVGTIGLSVAPDKHLTLVECDKYAFAELSKNSENVMKTAQFETVATNGELLRSEPFDRRRSRADETFTFRIEATPDGRPDRVDRRERAGSRSELSNNILAILSKSENALNYIEQNQTVILDPPRAGCDKKLIEKLLEVKPTKIIYLSCNPATQARDVKLLLDSYRIETVKTFNFFPHTPHIENLTILALK